jgi:hypothetical protein
LDKTSLCLLPLSVMHLHTFPRCHAKTKECATAREASIVLWYWFFRECRREIQINLADACDKMWSTGKQEMEVACDVVSR